MFFDPKVRESQEAIGRFWSLHELGRYEGHPKHRWTIRLLMQTHQNERPIRLQLERRVDMECRIRHSPRQTANDSLRKWPKRMIVAIEMRRKQTHC